MAEDDSLKSFSCLFNVSNVWILLILVVTSCHGATHWIVTENGRIERQANSYFNLQKPFDLVEFIHQEQRLNQMNVLQDDLNQEQQILQQVQEQEKSDITESFFKTDSSCKTLKKRLHDMDLNLNHVISFNSKGINVNDHIDVNQRIEKNTRLKTPLCQSNPSFSLQTFDHLAGIAERHKIRRTLEPGLLSVMPYAADTDVWGHRVASAMEKNSSSWVLQNMAALFWRIKGYTAEAANCLRQALYSSPRKHRDMSLFSLAIILHRANHSMDSIVLLHASLETTSHVPLHHLVLGVIYASIGQFDMSELCFQYVAETQSDFPPVVDMLEAVICERRYVQALHEQQKTLKEFVSKVKAVNHRQQLMQKLKLLDQQKDDFPLEQFAKQLHWLRKNLVKGRVYPMATDQNPNTRPTKQDKETIPCHIQDNVDSCSRNLKNGKVDVKKVKENNEKPSKKKRSSEKQSEAENIKSPSCGTLKGSSSYASSEDSEGPSSDTSSGTSECLSSNTLKGPCSDSSCDTLKCPSSHSSSYTPKGPSSDFSISTSQGPSSHSSSGTLNGHSNDTSSSTSQGPSSHSSSGTSQVPSSHSSSSTSQGPSRHSSSGTSKGPFSYSSSSTSQGPSSHFSSSTPQVPSSHSSSSTSQGPSRHSSSGTSKGPSSYSSSGTSKGPSSHSSSSTSQGPSSHFSSSTPQVPSSHSSSSTSQGPSRHSSSGTSKGPSSYSSSRTLKGPSSQSSSSTLNVPSSDTSSGISKDSSSHSSSSTSQGPSSHSSSGTSKGPSSHSSSRTLKGPSSDKSSGTSIGNIKSLVQKPSCMKKEQKPSANLPPKAHKDIVQDGKSVKEDNRSCNKQIRACVREAEKGFQSTFNPNDCKESDNMDALKKNKQFSVVTNFESKGIDVTKHVNFNEDISGIPRPPRCLGEIKAGHQSFVHLKGIKALSKMNLPPESGIKQTLLMHTMNAEMTVEQVGTQIHKALKKNSTSWVLLNLASIYWRIMGDTNEAVRCLRLALVNSPAKVQDVSMINLASILFKAGFFKDAATISKAVLEISPNAMIAHFTLGNSLAGQGKVTEATQHFLMALQIEPGFMAAVERLKIIQCILWRQQKELEKKAEDLRLLLMRKT